MKKLYMMFAISASIAGVKAQTLITYGNNSVSKDEFWRAYNKNKPSVTDKEKSLREYVDLYSNFKLKVKAAQDQHLDTLPQIQYDIQNFRSQVTDNYLNDEKGLRRLQDEAFDRSQKDIHVLHFSAPSNTADSIKTAKAIAELYADLKSGKTNYNELVKNISQKYTTVKQNDIGFITAFTVPYEYENVIYNTKTGDVSAPYQSKSGWHIFKVIEEKPGAGKWRVAQVLFTFPPDANEAVKMQLKHRADSVYALLQSGITFAAAAKTFSDDKLTYLNEGEMPEFGSGKYAYAFESEVFKLKKDGEISKPFETPFGYHIVKRISHKPTVTNRADETNMFELKQKIMGDSRINIEREKFAREIISKTGIRKATIVKDADLFRYADSLMKDPSAQRSLSFPISKKTVAMYGDKTTISGSEWLRFVRDYRLNNEVAAGENNQQVWNKFISFSATEYYKKHLENFNEDFKFQMQEFKEGNMLFEIMERNVWNKAITDTAGLKAYFAAHKEKYKWAESADIIVMNASTVKIAEDAMAAMKTGKDWKQMVEAGNGTIQADSGRYELTQIIGAEYITKVEKNTYSLVAPAADGSAAFVKYLTIYPGGMQRSFDEAKGLVINDYQAVLEEKWLATLKQQMPVKINESVFKQLLK